MKDSVVTFRRGVALVLVGLLLDPAPAFADCPAWSWCQVENKAHDVGNTAKDVGKGVLEGAKKGVEGTVRILKGAAQLATGHPGEAWASVSDGGKEIINGVIQIVVTGGVTVVTMADPVLGTIFFGSPSPLQGFAKFLYETISRWKGKPTCNPKEQAARFMTIPKKTLDDVARIAGVATTPYKYLSSIFDG